MHFIAEACYRRPLEPRALAYSRGGTAISMGLLFLAFCGYLINQIYNDHPLIQISSEQISVDIATPDIEMCAQNSTLSVVKCSAMYYNWTVVDIPNCWQNYFHAGANNETSKCYIFETNNRYRMATGLTYDNRNALRRLDFYWKIDNLANLTYSTISVPAIAIQLYDPHFTTWKPETVGNSPKEKEMATNIELGASRSTSFLNYTSGIFYYPQKYRAIKPGDIPSVLGLQPNYIDIMTIDNNQKDWPIQSNPPPPPPAFSKSLYQGFFSVQLAQSIIDVKTEIRQHTVLASVALAGGCYGVLTTIYILLFGMTRLTPWGLVHHVPVFISKHRHHNIDYNGERNNKYDNNHDDESLVGLEDSNKKGFSKTILVPWFFRSRMRGVSKTYTATDVKEAIMTKMVVRSKLQDQQQLTKVDSSEQHLLNTTASKRATNTSPSSNEIILNNYDQKYATSSIPLSPQQLNAETLYRAPPQIPTGVAPPLPTHYHFPGSSRSDNDITSVNMNETLHQEPERSNELDARTTELSNRIEELEIILSEYFINTAYLDQLRSRKNTTLSPSN